MAQTCCICGKLLGLFSEKTSLKDGYICEKCLRTGGIDLDSSIGNLLSDQVKEIIAKRKEVEGKFHSTNNFGRLKIDTNSHIFKIDNHYYHFDNLLTYAFHEDPENTRVDVKNGRSSGAAIGGAIGGLSGGLVGGAIGAAVGGKIGSIFSTMCNYMYIGIALKDASQKDLRLKFITEKTRISSDEYSKALRSAKECLDGLKIIADYNMTKQRSSEENQGQYSKKEVFIQNGHLSAEEFERELTIYKRLLYSNDISQEEFDQKKKKLLDMM